MPIDIDKTTGIIDTLKKMTSREISVTLFLIIGSIAAAFWIENRYAKIEETKSDIEKAEQEIKIHKAEIIQMHVRTLELIKMQPKEVQETIEKNSKAFMENYNRLQFPK